MFSKIISFPSKNSLIITKQGNRKNHQENWETHPWIRIINIQKSLSVSRGKVTHVAIELGF